MTERKDSSLAHQTAVWGKYYENRDALSFSHTAHGYQSLIDSIASVLPDIVGAEAPRTFLLGGFHPYNGTPTAFLDLVRAIHPNEGDTHILLDMNKEAVDAIPSAQSARGVVAPLEQIGFREGSLDFVFVDFTTDFMTDEQIKEFAERVSTQLSEQGILILVKKFLSAGKMVVSNNPNAPAFFPRSLQQMLNLMSQLKPIGFLSEEFDGETFIAFTRIDSSIPEATPTEEQLVEELKKPIISFKTAISSSYIE